MKRKKENKKERGITLIALVITIIVMLILVAATINITLNAGIFEKAGEAVEKTKIAMEDEQSQIDNAVKEMDRIMQENCNHDWGEWEDYGEEDMQKRTCKKCGKEETQKKKEYLPTTGDPYIGCYADLNGDHKITVEADGIIYADLAHSAEGEWTENNNSGYKYEALDTSSLKSYEIVGQCKGLFGEKEEVDIIAAVEGTGTEDRFYVMALRDLDDKTHYWYYNAYGKLNNLVGSDKINFTEDSGKQNTTDMLAIYGKSVGEGGYGESYTGDLWGMEELKDKNKANNGGWFVPSRAEWSAFGAMLWTKKNITSQTYNTYLKGFYWSSSQDSTRDAWCANFFRGYMDSYGVNYDNYVRLSATF